MKNFEQINLHLCHVLWFLQVFFKALSFQVAGLGLPLFHRDQRYVILDLFVYPWNLQVRYVSARNRRLTLISDLLSSVRLIKMYAWEKPYLERVQQIRSQEISHLFWLNVLDGVIDSIVSASSPVVSSSVISPPPILSQVKVFIG